MVVRDGLEPPTPPFQGRLPNREVRYEEETAGIAAYPHSLSGLLSENLMDERDRN